MGGPGSGLKSYYDPNIATEICRRVAAGESLRSVCRDEKMPPFSTVWEWIRANEDFFGQYSRARESLYEHWAEQILEISDDGTNDTYTVIDNAGNERELVNHDHINRSRLRVDSRKWLLSKLMPKKYGDKQTLEHTGADGGPVQVENKISVIQSIMGEIDGTTAHVTTQLPE